MNRIKILFFATLRERAGVKSLELDIPSDMTVEGLKEKLSTDYPNLKASMHAVILTVNREYAFEETTIPQNAEIGLFPPVSGG
jgi:molybdopterin converting factor subunit 1